MRAKTAWMRALRTYREFLGRRYLMDMKRHQGVESNGKHSDVYPTSSSVHISIMPWRAVGFADVEYWLLDAL